MHFNSIEEALSRHDISEMESVSIPFSCSFIMVKTVKTMAYMCNLTLQPCGGFITKSFVAKGAPKDAFKFYRWLERVSREDD